MSIYVISTVREDGRTTETKLEGFYAESQSDRLLQELRADKRNIFVRCSVLTDKGQFDYERGKITT